MWYHPEKNMHVGTGQPFQIGDSCYPANWLTFATTDEIADLGFVPVNTVGARGDERYYDNAEALAGETLTITATRKDQEAICALKWRDIKDERERRKAGGFKVAVDGVDKWFHSDADSRIQQIGLVMLGASIPAGLQWKTMDGSFVEMNPNLAQRLFAAAVAGDQAIFTVAEMHKAAMEAATNPENYDFSGAWPPIFGEA